MYKNHAMINQWTRSSDRLAAGLELVTARATAERTADGRDESHISIVGRIEKRLAELRERKQRGE